MSDMSFRDGVEGFLKDSSDPGAFLDEMVEQFGDLAAEGMSHVAATLPPDIAEHLTPYTAATSPVPSEHDSVDIDLADAVSLLASAPPWPDEALDGIDRADEAVVDEGDEFGAGETDVAVDDFDPADGLDGLEESTSVETETESVADPLDDLMVDEPTELTSDVDIALADGDPAALDDFEDDGFDA